MKPGETLIQHMEEVKELEVDFHIRELRIFGSVARHEDRDDSDLDVLAVYTDEATIFDHAAFSEKLKNLLGKDCDVLSDEILDKQGFENLMENSISLEAFAASQFVKRGAVSQEARESSGDDNMDWIIRRIADTVTGLTYEEFAADPIRYDALAYQFQLLGSIAENAGKERLKAISQKYHVDLSGCAVLPEILLTTLYPRLLYQTAKKLSGASASQ